MDLKKEESFDSSPFDEVVREDELKPKSTDMKVDLSIPCTEVDYIEFEPLSKGRLEPLKLTYEDAEFIEFLRQQGVFFPEIHEVWYDPVYTLKEVKNVHKKFRQECETFTPGDIRELESIFKKQLQKAWRAVVRQMGKSMEGCKRIAKEKNFSLF